LFVGENSKKKHKPQKQGHKKGQEEISFEEEG